jgi:hypothetical protein
MRLHHSTEYDDGMLIVKASRVLKTAPCMNNSLQHPKMFGTVKQVKLLILPLTHIPVVQSARSQQVFCTGVSFQCLTCTCCAHTCIHGCYVDSY